MNLITISVLDGYKTDEIVHNLTDSKQNEIRFLSRNFNHAMVACTVESQNVVTTVGKDIFIKGKITYFVI